MWKDLPSRVQFHDDCPVGVQQISQSRTMWRHHRFGIEEQLYLSLNGQILQHGGYKAQRPQRMFQLSFIGHRSSIGFAPGNQDSVAFLSRAPWEYTLVKELEILGRQKSRVSLTEEVDEQELLAVVARVLLWREYADVRGAEFVQKVGFDRSRPAGQKQLNLGVRVLRVMHQVQPREIVDQCVVEVVAI